MEHTALVLLDNRADIFFEKNAKITTHTLNIADGKSEMCELITYESMNVSTTKIAEAQKLKFN